MEDTLLLNQAQVLTYHNGGVNHRKRAREELVFHGNKDMPAAKRQVDIYENASVIEASIETSEIRIVASFVGGGLFTDEIRNPFPSDITYFMMLPKAATHFTLTSTDVPFNVTAWKLVGVVLAVSTVILHLRRIVAPDDPTTTLRRIKTELTSLEFGANNQALVAGEQTVTSQVTPYTFFGGLFKHCRFEQQTADKITLRPKSHNNHEHILIKQDLTFIHPSLVPGFALDKIEATRTFSAINLYAGTTVFTMYLKSYTTVVQ